MKLSIYTPIFLLLLLVLNGCGDKSSDEQTFITVDVDKSYSKKEFILQDLFDIEYVRLETNEKFLTSGKVRSIGENLMLFTDSKNGGDIHVTDGKGKYLRTINRKGQSGEEYVYINTVIYDEKNQELYVNDTMTGRIQVYDLFGNFKRSIKHLMGATYFRLDNFNQDYLNCYEEPTADPTDSGYEEAIPNSGFMLVSKQDGSVQRIAIPFDVYVSGTIISENSGQKIYAAIQNSPLIPYFDNWLLTEISTDTIYLYETDKRALKPFLVRTPSGKEMNPPVYLFPGVMTDRYYFLQSLKFEFNFSKGTGFPPAELVYDKQEDKVYRYEVYNQDVTKDEPLNLVWQFPPLPYLNNRNGIAFLSRMEAPGLVEAYEDGKLQGPLKEIAADLEEESNPVIMIARYKNE